MSMRPEAICGPTRGAVPPADGRRRSAEDTPVRANDRAPKGAAYIVAHIVAQTPNVVGGQKMN